MEKGCTWIKDSELLLLLVVVEEKGSDHAMRVPLTDRETRQDNGEVDKNDEEEDVDG